MRQRPPQVFASGELCTLPTNTVASVRNDGAAGNLNANSLVVLNTTGPGEGVKNEVDIRELTSPRKVRWTTCIRGPMKNKARKVVNL